MAAPDYDALLTKLQASPDAVTLEEIAPELTAFHTNHAQATATSKPGYEDYEFVGSTKSAVDPAVKHADDLKKLKESHENDLENIKTMHEKKLKGFRDKNAHDAANSEIESYDTEVARRTKAHEKAVESHVKTGKPHGTGAQSALDAMEKDREKVLAEFQETKKQVLDKAAKSSSVTPDQYRKLEEDLVKHEESLKRIDGKVQGLINDTGKAAEEACGVASTARGTAAAATGAKTISDAAYKGIKDRVMGNIGKGVAVAEKDLNQLGFFAKNVTAPIKANFASERSMWMKGGRVAVSLIGVYPVVKGLQKLGQWTGMVSPDVDPVTKEQIQPDGGTAAAGLGLTAAGLAIIGLALTFGGKGNILKGFTKA